MLVHKKYMKRCIQLAYNGIGTASPNPLVGSVIVYNNQIIGEGWHYKAGEAHAEVRAINSVKDQALLKNATIYVSLEPCSHYGKTPPCSDLIIEKGIKKVVIGTIDPFAKVSGNGIKKLIAAGCDVVVGVLEKECNELNKRFFTFHNQKRPYIILKWAETANGFIAPTTRQEQQPVWITNAYSRQLTHKWRAEEDAIMVGSNTVVADNPKLTIRDWTGENPTRVVLDRSGKVAKDVAITNPEARTVIITSTNQVTNDSKYLSYHSLNKNTKSIVSSICTILHNQEIQSIIIEGGTQLLQAFINENKWDEARVFTGATTFTSGISAPQLKRRATKEETIKNDTLRYYKND